MRGPGGVWHQQLLVVYKSPGSAPSWSCSGAFAPGAQHGHVCRDTCAVER